MQVFTLHFLLLLMKSSNKFLSLALGSINFGDLSLLNLEIVDLLKDLLYNVFSELLWNIV